MGQWISRKNIRKSTNEIIQAQKLFYFLAGCLSYVIASLTKWNNIKQTTNGVGAMASVNSCSFKVVMRAKVGYFSSHMVETWASNEAIIWCIQQEWKKVLFKTDFHKLNMVEAYARRTWFMFFSITQEL